MQYVTLRSDVKFPYTVPAAVGFCAEEAMQEEKWKSTVSSNWPDLKSQGSQPVTSEAAH
jgi:hypothetical protein